MRLGNSRKTKTRFVSGRDVFAVLPTVFGGKTLRYNVSTVHVISPLIILALTPLTALHRNSNRFLLTSFHDNVWALFEITSQYKNGGVM